MKNIIILYHNDEDGFGGAWAAWKKFKNNADYIPVQYRTKTAPPAGLKNKEVYLVDLCYGAEFMKKLFEESKKLVVIDHHIGRKEEVKISTEHLFDLNYSGATLAWKYFHPGKPTPQLLRYIEDFDLWKFKMPHSRELFASLNIYDFHFLTWDKLVREFENSKKIKKHLEAGKAILRFQNSLIKDILRFGEDVIFENHRAFAVNSPVLESKLGHWIYDKKKMLGVVWSYQKGLFKTSLRSDSGLDVSKLAKKYGGGGHKNAAGFCFDAKIKFPWKKIK